MKAKFRCPSCQQKIAVTETAMGKRAKCPACQQTIQVPTLQEFRSAAAAAGMASEPVSPPTVDLPPLDDLFDDLPDSDPFADAAAAADNIPASRELAPAKKSRGSKNKSTPNRPERPKTWRAFGGMVLGVVLMLAVLPASFGAFYVASQMVASNSWPSVQGRVFDSYVRSVRVGRRSKYRADVRYEYYVNGGVYSGSRVRLGDTTGNSESAQQAIADKYPIDKQVQVYYDPESPEQSVLEPGGLPWTMAIPPLLLGVIGWLFFGVSTGRIDT